MKRRHLIAAVLLAVPCLAGMGCRTLTPAPCETAGGRREALAAQQTPPPPSAHSPQLGDDNAAPAEQVASFEQPLAPLPPPPEGNGPLPESPEALGYSLEQLEQMALAHHPAIGEAAARVSALRGKWVQAGLKPNPQLGYSGEEIGNSGKAGIQSAYVSQQFLTGGKLELSRAVVSREIMAAEQEWAARERQVLTDVRLGFYEVLLAQRRREIAADLVEVGAGAVRTSQNLFDAKEIPKIGLLQAETESQQARLELRRGELEYAAAWRRLATVMGQPQLAPQRLAGSLEPAEAALDWETERAELLAQSPEMSAAVAEVERARWALARAQAEPSCDPTVQLGVGYDAETGDPIAGVQVQVPWRVHDRNQGAIREAHGELAAANQNLARVELDLQNRLAAAFGDYAIAREQVETFQREILPRATETLELVRNGYERGEVGYLDMLSAQRTYFQTSLANLESLRALWRSRLLIEGMLLRGGLEEGR